MNYRKANTNHPLKNRLNPYPAYKDSGIEWLGGIPAHWEVKRLKYAVNLNPASTEARTHDDSLEVSFVPMEAVGEYGGLALVTTKPIRDVYDGYTYFREGDVLVAKITPCFENGKGAIATGLVNKIAFGTTELHILRTKRTTNRQFLFYLSMGDAFRKLGQAEMYGAGGQKRVPESFITDLLHPIPPVPEQRAIAAFLDRETAKIDALVAKKERLIELLQEKRSALISQAVTKGLDPDVSMKGSGVEWLGEVPAHWEVKRLRSAIKFQRGHDLPSDDREEGDVPVVSSSGISAMHSKAVATAPGIVTGRCGTIGQFYLINQSYWPHNTALYSIDLHGNKPRFLRYMLIHMSPLFCLHSIKSAVPAVDRNDIHADYTTVPPLPEQRAIADFLDRETAKIDTLVANVRQVNERLKELRSALISAAVTGKIDVRDAPARAPDESGNSTADGSVMPGASGGMGRRDETRRNDL